MAHNHSHKHHEHHHHHDVGNIRVAFFLNLSFTVIELIGGLLTNSIAIISDAVHDFGDSLSLGLAWYFQGLAKKGSNERYSYGYKRFSLLGAIVNSLVLTIGSIFILYEAVPRIFAPQATDAQGMFWLAVLGIIVNGMAALRVKKGASSINERVVSLHLLEDVLGWAAILVGSIVMYFFDCPVIDPILSIGISCFVLFNVVRNIRDTLHIILQRSPQEIDIPGITNKIKQLENVESIHDLHVWAMDENYNVLTVHILVNQSLTMEQLACLKMQIRELLQEEQIQHATIEFEAPGELCRMEDCVH